MDWKEGRGESTLLYDICCFNSLVHETIVPLNLIKLAKIKTKHASVQSKRKALFTLFI